MGLAVDIMYTVSLEEMQIKLEVFKVAVLQNNSCVVDKITNNIEISLSSHSSGGEGYILTAESNDKFDIFIEKMSGPLVSSPIDAEVINVD